MRSAASVSFFPLRRISTPHKINFVWDLLEEAWQNKFNELKEFQLEQGHASPIVRDTSLGKWVDWQRQIYKKGKLSPERIELLNSISFSFYSRDIVTVDWNDKFEELRNFYLNNGHSSPPVRHKTLGKWIDWQRQEYKKGKLSLERINLLESINFKLKLR